MEANYVHKDSTTLVQDELVKNELNQIELQYNALKQQKFNELLKENQELKEKYLNAVADYEMVMSELQELKKQLEENTETLLGRILELRGQQKEFIKWLENYLELLDYNNIEEQIIYDTIEEILQKYKEIIEGKE